MQLAVYGAEELTGSSWHEATGVEPSEKLTVPVGTVAPAGETATVAVRVTGSFTVGLDGEAVTVVVVETVVAWLTVTSTGVEVDPVKFTSPP